MDLQTRKIEFVQKFLNLQNEDTIAQLEQILLKEIETVKDNDFQPMTIEEFNIRIDESMDDSKNDRLIEASELEAKINEWS